MYFVTRVFFDAESGEQRNSIQKFDDLTSAKKRFYSILASDIDKKEYSYELVQIVDEHGLTVATQMFDNRAEVTKEG